MSKIHNFSKLLIAFQGTPSIDIDFVKQELNLSTASAYRYLSNLEEIGFLEKKTTSNYILGPLIIELDRIIRENDPLIQAASRQMAELAYHLDEAVVVLARLYGPRVLCVHQVKGIHSQLNISYERGKAMPLFRGATSKAVLAWLSESRIEEIYQLVKDDPTFQQRYSSFDRLTADLQEIRRNKTCMTYSEIDPGVYGIASPIFQGQKLIGSLSIVIPESRMNQLNIKKINDQIYRLSLQISARLESQS
ncbi:IclR family transcriptional regulator [Acinetobacter baumannii]|uniref:IclR family transcriptional regulator n=1 Tax=Acinetobacter baumannii TaxID=470 RepID=UPI003AF5CEB3